ncbi:MAG: hypothetical protein ACI8Q6_003596 [Granulosicoccus sp.]|jgi:hypothetical protein
MESDDETRTIYRIASHLKLTIGQVLDLPAEEVRGWTVYLSTHQ